MESVDRQLPEDPVAFIQACVRKRQILWTYHVNMHPQTKNVEERQCFLDPILKTTAEGAVTVVLTRCGDFYGRALEDGRVPIFQVAM